MKLYVSVDIEGVSGISSWDETHSQKPEFAYFRQRMAEEASAVCEGAYSVGVSDILVKDAHGLGRNMQAADLPPFARLCHGMNNHPFLMMAELDESYDGVMMVGYHSGAAFGGNPLAHTLRLSVASMKINGVLASEYLINAYTAAYCGVPVLLVSGDERLCQHVGQISPATVTCPVSRGVGEASVGYHPSVVREMLKKAGREAVQTAANIKPLAMPQEFTVEILFTSAVAAYRAAFYPGMRTISATEVAYKATDYMDVLCMLLFTLC